MQRRIEDVLKQVAEKHDLPVEVIKQIYRSTFSQMRQSMLELRTVRLINIGLWIARRTMLMGNNPYAKKFKQDPRYGGKQN
jgi:nucleoid DNA-binding protein